MESQKDLSLAESKIEDSSGLLNTKSLYFSGCSKVSIEAYNRVLEQLNSLKNQDILIEETLKKQLHDSEEKERTKREKLKKEMLANKEILELQIKLKKEKEMQEKMNILNEGKQTLAQMPENLINIFPRITETPKQIRHGKKIKLQEEVKMSLKQQMENKLLRTEEKKQKEKQQECENIQKTNEKEKKEDETKKTEREKKDGTI